LVDGESAGLGAEKWRLTGSFPGFQDGKVPTHVVEEK